MEILILIRSVFGATCSIPTHMEYMLFDSHTKICKIGENIENLDYLPKEKSNYVSISQQIDMCYLRILDVYCNLKNKNNQIGSERKKKLRINLYNFVCTLYALANKFYEIYFIFLDQRTNEYIDNTRNRIEGLRQMQKHLRPRGSR